MAGEIGHHPDNATGGARGTAEPDQRLRLAPKTVEAIGEQRRVLIRRRHHHQALTGREFSWKILLDRERLPKIVACEVGDAEPPAAEHTLDGVPVQGSTLRKGVSWPGGDGARQLSTHIARLPRFRLADQGCREAPRTNALFVWRSVCLVTNETDEKRRYGWGAAPGGSPKVASREKRLPCCLPVTGRGGWHHHILELNIRLDVVDFTGFPFNRGVSIQSLITAHNYPGGGGHRDDVASWSFVKDIGYGCAGQGSTHRAALPRGSPGTRRSRPGDQ